MTASSPDISITVTFDNENDLSIKFETNRGDRPLAVKSGLSSRKLDEYRKELYKGLHKFRGQVGNNLKKEKDFQRVSDAMSCLHEVGRQLNFQLFGTDRYSVEDFLRQACPTWQRSESEGYRPPIVEITNRIEHALPLEFLPLFDTSLPPKITSYVQLTCVASRFLGFSAIIHRVFRDPSIKMPSQATSGAVLENVPSLGVRFFQHAGLVGAKKEREFFEQADWIDLRGPWPDQLLSLEEFISELALQLWNAVDSSGAKTPQLLDQVHHFACHCDTDKVNSFEYSLYLANKSGLIDKFSLGTGHGRRAAIEALEKQFGSLPQRRQNEAYPLVFLNACGSSKLTASGVTSFPILFLKIGNRGVIGTETRVPDLFAAAFSEQFYLNLIEGSTLGEALYDARWKLLKRYKNPLGILYTVYADPDLHVRKPNPKGHTAVWL